MNDEIMEAAEAPEADEWKDIQNVIADAIHHAVAQRDARIAELEVDRDDWRKCVELIASATDIKTLSGVTIAETILGIRARIAELEAVVEKKCEWREFDADDIPGTYETSCGRAFSCTEDDIHENRITHCPFCGGVIREAAEAARKEQA